MVSCPYQFLYYKRHFPASENVVKMSYSSKHSANASTIGGRLSGGRYPSIVCITHPGHLLCFRPAPRHTPERVPE